MIAGECFGLTSLTQENSKRICAVTALKPTHCLVISKAAWKAMLRVNTQRLEAELLQLLKENEMTKGFGNAMRKKMVKDFEKVFFNTRGRVIFAEDEPAEYVYFV